MAYILKCDYCGRELPVEANRDGDPATPTEWKKKIIVIGGKAKVVHACRKDCQYYLGLTT
jgi:hypothetical protein